MTFHLRELELPGDYESLAQLLNQDSPEPVTAAQLEAEDAKMYETGHTWKDEKGLLAGYDRSRRVAVTDEGDVVGYLNSWRAPWTEPGYICNTLIVDTGHRNQGIGSLLLAHALEWGQGIGASALLTVLWDNQPDYLRFAENRGFVIERHTFQSVLTLDAGQTSLHPGPEELLAPSGLVIKTIAELADEASLQKLFQLSIGTMPDIPGYLGTVPDYDSWRKWYLEVSGFTPELVLIAVDGDRFAGYTNVIFNEDTNGLYHEYTTVHKDYRGKKIAQALKLKAIELGIERKAAYIRTDNDSLNEPILSINRKLGYLPEHGHYRILAPIEAVIQKTTAQAR
ncbi:GNAT family N-acetyltransferase [Paenibacillus sp. CAU 1782]